MKIHLKTLALGVAGLVAIPTLVIGSSFVNSLISGKTPEEAVVILGDQLDLVLGRVNVVEQKAVWQEASSTEMIVKQTALIESQNLLETKQNELKAKQDEIDLQAAALAQQQANLAAEQARAKIEAERVKAEADARAAALEAQAVALQAQATQTQAAVEQIQNPPAPVSRSLEVSAPLCEHEHPLVCNTYLPTRLEGDKYFTIASERVVILRFKLTNIGNADVNVSKMFLGGFFQGDRSFLSSLWVETDDGLIIGEKVKKDDSELPIVVSITPNTSKNFVVYCDIKPDVEVEFSGTSGRRSMGHISLDGIISNSDNLKPIGNVLALWQEQIVFVK